ncbi:RING finger protein 207 isoform X2 [Desmodus rotundus]|uniref:RING finger protein 207 isoform X2 n=1 Tax=Desmodus rotundus TaxID=9430 RepID=UPI002380F68C|nr:RING finger protein 207 isoform X2 [Desmodus rotundus]
MSGAIFAPLEGPGALDAASGHPLVCPLCHAQYERPCLLDCFHHFCAGCLRGRAADGRLACPLCQHQTVVKGPSGLPPVDRLLQFLVDSSGDGLEVVHCANCDLECSKQDSETTYFCNTCGQPLCARCREETHRARMFERHDIVALGQHSRDMLQKCTLHTEPYIMFSTDKKSLLCIRCFRDMQGESRAHCVDLESAYVQGCERLQQAVLAVKALQTATREAIVLLQAMVEEVRCSAAEEEAAIHSLFGSIQEVTLSGSGMQEGGPLAQADPGQAAAQASAPGVAGAQGSGRELGGGPQPAAACPSQDRLAERKALLLQAVQSQYEEKDKAFKEQLSHLATLLPTLQVHLVICSSFLSLANKAQFLDLGYELIERLQGIAAQPHRLQPAQSSKIISDHRAEFSRCLEPLLLPPPGAHWAAGAGGSPNTLAGDSGPKGLGVPSCPSPVGKMLGPPVQKPTLHRSISTKVLLAEGEETPFMEHCRHFEDSYRHLQAETQSLKDQVQELHRDLTKHHSLIKAEIMGDILRKALQVDARIAAQCASVEGMRALFQEMWEESYQRVANEQEIYEAQLRDLVQLKQENACLTAITKHITPYVRSIAKVKERLEPRLQAPVGEESEHLQNVREDGTGDETQARSSFRILWLRFPCVHMARSLGPHHGDWRGVPAHGDSK